MGITLQLADGTLLPAGGGPWQRNADGDPVLSVSSSPYGAAVGGSYEHLYRTQPWVAITVNFLTRQFARIPLKTYELDSQNVKTPVTRGPLYDLVRRPAPRCGPVHLKQWLAFPTLLHGNGTLKKERPRPGAPPRYLRPLRWAATMPYEHQPGSDVVDYWINLQLGEPRVIQPYDVLHLAWTPPSGFIGISPLEQLGVTMCAEIARQRYEAAVFRNAARPSGGVTLPDTELSKNKEFRQELRDDLSRLHTGVENAGRPIILPPGSEWQQFSLSAREVELVAQRELNRDETVASWNAPPPLVGILEHATYSNITELHKILYGPVLGPWFGLAEDCFKAQVIDDEPAFQGQWVEFELAAVLSGDPLKEAMALKTQLQTGLLTINEARQIRNLPSIDHPDCDLPMIPANNVSFVGRREDPVAGALARNLGRVGERLYRKTRAGDDGAWDPGRFERELRDDLQAAGASRYERDAKTWVGVVTAVVADAMGDADRLRDSFAALTPTRETT